MDSEVRRARAALQAAKTRLAKGIEAGLPESKIKSLERYVEMNLRRYRDAITDRELSKG